jgi:hypothetical protein
MAKPKPLSGKQRQHLMVLAGGERCAYPGLHMGTLEAMERRGLVQARRGLGSIAMPHTAIKWWLTPAGRAALAQALATEKTDD